MKDKFISNEGFEIPLSESDFIFVEENPRFKDTFWTNYTLPVNYYYTRDFLSKFGHYSSGTADGLKKYHEGIHLFEGKPRKAKLEILQFSKDFVKIQIDSGFETLPNFDKKLEDLPLLDLEVEDIYRHANQIVLQKYPETNYNFPKIYTDQYNTDEEQWKYFDSFLNNRADYESSDGKAFLKNRVENGMDVYNKNIIHPLPYLLYILKVGFQDAGFRLEGEILEDPYLKQQLVFSGRPYYDTGEQKQYKINIYHQDFDNTDMPTSEGKWNKTIKIEAPGKYLMKITVQGRAQQQASVKVGSMGIAALETQQTLYFEPGQWSKEINFDVSEKEAENGSAVILHYSGYHPANRIDSDGKNIGAVQILINPKRLHTKEGEPIAYVFNQNRIQLKKAMPEITFGELVTTIKNLRNYDLEFEGNRAIMNIIRPSGKIEDFRYFEDENPVKMFNDKVFFNLKFPENEAVEVQNIFFDSGGYHLNKKNIPNNTTEININMMFLPLVMFRGSYTAKAFNDSSILMLIWYDGLDSEGNNHAGNHKNISGQTLAEHLKPWYLNRLTNYSYKWNFITPKNKLRNFNIRSEIFCYNKRHLIKSWTKKNLSPELYAVEIETETY